MRAGRRRSFLWAVSVMTASALAAPFFAFAAPEIDSPPRARWSDGEKRRVLARGSYCSREGCVDRATPIGNRTLRAQRGERIALSFRHRVEAVSVARKSGRRFAKAKPADGRNSSRWFFRARVLKTPRKDLIVSVRYSGQRFDSAEFGGRLAVR